MIKQILAVTTGTLFFAAAAVAAEGDFQAADINADGVLTLEEAQAAMPHITDNVFRAADADGSGTLSQDEFATIAS